MLPSFQGQLPPKYWSQGSSPPSPLLHLGALQWPLFACYSAFSQGLGQGASKTGSPSGVGVVGQPVEVTPQSERWSAGGQ